MTTLHQVRAAVIGYGGIGSAHTASIAQGKVKGMTLAAVCDINPARLDIVRERFPGVRCEADYHALLDGSIDAVIIAVPHPMHCQIAAEKPISAAVTSILSAIGSKNLPKSVTILCLRAYLPSNISVSDAAIKITSATM